MLSEFLQTPASNVNATWHTVMSGVDVCRFTVDRPETGFPIVLPLELQPLHFEALFCNDGTLMLGRKRGSPIAIGRQEILLLSSNASLSSARIAAPLDGILVSVDALNAGESLETLCRLLGNLRLYTAQLKEQMAEREGCAQLRGSAWSRAVFGTLDALPEDEKSNYCVLKILELLYLLCTGSELLEDETQTVCPDSYLTRTVADMQAYMESRLDEKLTIDVMSSKFHISPTAFKSCFRRINGQPVHQWLQTLRMRRAAEYLCSSPMTVLQIAQAVGYEGASQFNVAFKRQYGVTPSQYRKMSNTGEL